MTVSIVTRVIECQNLVAIIPFQASPLLIDEPSFLVLLPLHVGKVIFTVQAKEQGVSLLRVPPQTTAIPSGVSQRWKQLKRLAIVVKLLIGVILVGVTSFRSHHSPVIHNRAIRQTPVKGFQLDDPGAIPQHSSAWYGNKRKSLTIVSTVIVIEGAAFVGVKSERYRGRESGALGRRKTGRRSCIVKGRWNGRSCHNGMGRS